jgi:hypothetical protein
MMTGRDWLRAAFGGSAVLLLGVVAMTFAVYNPSPADGARLREGRLRVPAYLAAVVAAILLAATGRESALIAVMFACTALTMVVAVTWRSAHRQTVAGRAERDRLDRDLQDAVAACDAPPLPHPHLRERLTTSTDLANATFDETVLGPLGEGLISFIRPTRRFFRTPQQDDALDQAAIQAFTKADSLLEPELLTRVLATHAALEHLRVKLEHARSKRSERRGSPFTELRTTRTSRAPGVSGLVGRSLHFPMRGEAFHRRTQGR